MKNLYKNRKPDSRVVASVKYEINKNHGLLSDSLLDSCLKAVDNNAKKSAWNFQAVKVKYKAEAMQICIEARKEAKKAFSEGEIFIESEVN